MSGNFFSTQEVIGMMQEGNCYYIINRDGDAVFTTKNRVIQIMGEVGSNFWQVKRENGILTIRSMERTEWIRKWNKGEPPGSPHPKPTETPPEPEPKKGKVRLI